ncbi:MAG: rhomboid family intramembrane serine protease [Bacteroidales bacterium]|jgi:membrane associated rhomboid family serine protease|nr:rhomboid family intramembrane serine protease [Bacteroidales bacterium]
MNQFYQQQRRPNPLEDLKRFFKDSSILPRLMIINIGVWILIQVAFVVGWAFNRSDITVEMAILDYLALPASPDLLIYRPWTLITYMFLHTSFWHILFNMLWLYWFGKIFTQYLSQRQLLVTYLLGGLAGGLLYILAYNALPVFTNDLVMARALGASASVMAIVAAISFYVPNYTINLIFLGRVKIFYLALALFVLDFFMIRHGNAGGHIAHIGGAIYGFFYVYYLRKGRDFSKIFPRFRGISGWKSRIRRKPGTKTNNVKRPKSDEEFNRERAAKQKRIDHILDKISRSGYDSLTKEEKELLFNQSNKK